MRAAMSVTVPLVLAGVLAECGIFVGGGPHLSESDS